MRRKHVFCFYNLWEMGSDLSLKANKRNAFPPCPVHAKGYETLTSIAFPYKVKTGCSMDPFCDPKGSRRSPEKEHHLLFSCCPTLDVFGA